MTDAERNQRIYHHLYETCEGIAQQTERIVNLEELVLDMWHEGMCECGSLGKCATCIYEYPTRMRELGIEVNDG